MSSGEFFCVSEAAFCLCFGFCSGFWLVFLALFQLGLVHFLCCEN